MRSLLLPSLGLLLVFLAGCAAPASTTPTAPGPPVATEPVVLRPVTESGAPAAGYTVTDDEAVALDCGTTSSNTRPSPAAVDDNILSCSPSSAYAVACWEDPAPSTVLCYRDPWNMVLVRMPNGTGFPTATAPAQAQPLGLLLSDGDRCLIRSGGAWNDLTGHPGWYGTYSCAEGGAVWAESADGIDRSSPLWTVHIAPISGTGPVSTRGVVKAYFVGTEPD